MWLVYDRYENQLRVFTLVSGQYQQVEMIGPEQKFWL